MPIVAVGDAVYPVLTNNTPADDVAEAGAVSETTGSFTAEVLTARQNPGEFFLLKRRQGTFCRHG